jgi:hypothetical protein
LAGIGTLDFPGCQRVIEPVSCLFYINPCTVKVKDVANKEMEWGKSKRFPIELQLFSFYEFN